MIAMPRSRVGAKRIQDWDEMTWTAHKEVRTQRGSARARGEGGTAH